MPTQIDQEMYEKAFGPDPNSPKRRRALQQALDIRKFEIQLYWTRAAYFWAFIAASFAAYGALRAAQMVDRDLLSTVVGCTGFVFSVAWYFVNRGSKLWQENWENHVDMLENGITGPLYKILLVRPPAIGFRARSDRILTGPGRFSVSKINQLVSIYVAITWILLISHSIPCCDTSASLDPIYVVIILTTLAAVSSLWLMGRIHKGEYSHEAHLRESRILPLN